MSISPEEFERCVQTVLRAAKRVRMAMTREDAEKAARDLFKALRATAEIAFPEPCSFKVGDACLVRGKRATVTAVVGQWAKVTFESGKVRYAAVHVDLLRPIPARAG